MTISLCSSSWLKLINVILAGFGQTSKNYYERTDVHQRSCDDSVGVDKELSVWTSFLSCTVSRNLIITGSIVQSSVWGDFEVIALQRQVVASMGVKFGVEDLTFG